MKHIEELVAKINTNNFGKGINEYTSRNVAG
jgi:hypothetical protein